MSFTSTQCHKSAHASHVSTGHMHILIFIRHDVSDHVQNKVMTSDYNYSVFYLTLASVKLDFYLFAGLNTFTALLDHTEPVSSYKRHGCTCTSCKRSRNELVAYFADLHAYIFLMLEARYKSLRDMRIESFRQKLWTFTHHLYHRRHEVFETDICAYRISRKSDDRLTANHCQYHRLSRFDGYTVDDHFTQFAKHVNSEILSPCT